MATKVESRMGISSEAITQVAQIKLKPFLTDPKIMLDACKKADEYFFAEFGLHAIPHVPLHGWWPLTLLDIRIDYPEDAWPHPTDRLGSPKDIEKLKIPKGNFFQTKALEPVVLYDKAVCKVTGDNSHLHDGMALGPVTFARTVRGDDFFLDLYDCPDMAHKLLDFATEFHLEFQRQLLEYTGGQIAPLMHIADDFAGMIPPAMWDEFVIPYWKRIFTERGVKLGYKTRMLHSELMNPAQQMIAVKNLPINMINCGQDPNVTIDDMNATGLKYEWFIKALQFLNGTPEDIKNSFTEAAQGGAPVIIGTIYHRDISPENIHAFLDTAKEYK